MSEQTLPDPGYPAGAEGMLGEDCWTRAQVLALLAAERERCAKIFDARRGQGYYDSPAECAALIRATAIGDCSSPALPEKTKTGM